MQWPKQASKTRTGFGNWNHRQWELADTIADTSQRIKNVGSDTRNIEAFTQAVQGVAAGFQLAQGAAGLFGQENEDVQKAILKVQSAMAIANGVQQIANLLQKESASLHCGQ